MWLGADGLRMSAAMAFYGMLSLAPLLVLVVAALGWWVDRSLVEANLLEQIAQLTGERTASVVREALASARAPAQGLWASLIALVLLVWGATGVFAELQNAFCKLWLDPNAPPSKRPAWSVTASLRLRGLAYILAMGFLLLISLTVSAGLAIASGAGWQSGLDRQLLRAIRARRRVVRAVAVGSAARRVAEYPLARRARLHPAGARPRAVSAVWHPRL